MATNSFLKSPFQALIDQQDQFNQMPGSDAVKDVEIPAIEAAPVEQVSQPAPVAAPRQSKPKSLAPPAELRQLFEVSAQEFGVPANVLMAIAQQESSYNNDATNSTTGAAGMAQYMDATAKSLKINARDPNESIPATAMQIKERLDKGMSLDDAIREHFAGPNRRGWGPKTAAYGTEVLSKAEQIANELYGEQVPVGPTSAQVTPDDAPLPNFGVTPEALSKIRNQWNAATPDERVQMESIRGPRGYIAKELNKRQPARQAAPNPLGLDIDPMAQTREAYKNPTLDSIDPRAEARARNLVNQGMEGNTANQVGRAAALAGMAPGTEPGIGQRIENTDFDFEARKKYSEDPFFSNPAVRGAVKGYEGYKRGILGLNQFAGEVLGAETLAGISKQGAAESRKDEAAMGDAGSYAQRQFEGAVGSIAQQLPALIGGVATGSEALVLGTMFAQTFGNEYGEGRARGQNEEQAVGRAALYGTFEVIGEKLGLGDALKGLRGAVSGETTRDVATSMARALLKEVPGEQLTTLGQFATDKLPEGYGLNTEAGLAEYLQMAADTAVQTVIQGGIMGGAATGTSAAINRLRGERAQPEQMPQERIEPTMDVVPAQAGTTEQAAPQDFQTNDEGFTAQIMGDDGLMHTVDSRTGVTMAEPPAEPKGMLESALVEAAELHANDPAPAPVMPEPEPAPPDYTVIPSDDLRARVKEIAQLSQQDMNQRKQLMPERKAIEKEIAARAKQAKADSKPAEEPLTAGPFEDISAANSMMMRYAEQTGVPHEVVVKEGSFRIQPLKEQDNGIDSAGTERGIDGRGRSGGTPAELGSGDGIRSEGTGDGTVVGRGNNTGERVRDAVPDRVPATGTADAQPALSEPARNPYQAYSASKPETAEAYMDKRGIDRNQFEVQQTGPVRWQVVPRTQPVETEVMPNVSERTQVPEEAPVEGGAQSAPEVEVKPEQATGAINLVRMTNAKDFDWGKSKPNGTYASIADDPDSFVSPFADDYKEGRRVDLKYEPKNPLEVGDLKVKHARFRGALGNEGESSAGIKALNAILSPEEFAAALKMSKAEVQAAIAERFPKVDASKAHDAYEALEIWGAQEAKARGHDIIIARDGAMPQFSEAVLLAEPKPAAKKPKRVEDEKSKAIRIRNERQEAAVKKATEGEAKRKTAPKEADKFSVSDQKSVPSDELKQSVLTQWGKIAEPINGYSYLAGVNKKNNRGIFVVDGNFDREAFKAAMGEASSAGLDVKKLYIVAERASYTGASLDIVKFSDFAEDSITGFNKASFSVKEEIDSPIANVSTMLQKLADDGKIVLHDDASSLPFDGKVPAGAQAMTAKDGAIHVVVGSDMAVVLHEAFHAGAQKLIGTARWNSLMTRLDALYRQSERSSGKAREFFDAARGRVATAKAKGAVADGMAVEEFGAYAIEEYESAPLTVRKWVDDLLGSVKAWALRRFGAQLGQVSPAQLSALAKSALLDVRASREQVAYSTKQTTMRVLYRGTNDSGEKIKGGIQEGTLFAAGYENVARAYAGSDGRIEQIGVMADAKILVEGSKEFATVTGRRRGKLLDTMRRGENLKTAADDAAVKAREAGYDAIEYTSFRDLGIAIFNESKFIRNYDPSNTDIRFSVAGSPQPRTLTPDEQGLLRRVQAQIQDGMNRVKQVQKRITDITGRIEFGPADVYRAETNRPGRIAARKEDARDKLFKPLMTRLAKSGYAPKQLETLLHAQHANERNAKIAEINPEFSDGGSGMTNKRAQEVLDEYPEQSNAELYEIANQARTIAHEILKMKMAYGLISKDDFDSLSDAYDFYIPLKGDGEYGFKLKRAMGHDERDEHIMENIVRDYEQAIVAGEKNLARQSLLQLILQHPDDALWTARVPPKGRKVVSKGNKWVVTHNGMTLGEFDSEIEANRQSELWAMMGGDHFMNYEVTREKAGEKVKDFVLPLQDHEILVYVKGDAVRLQIYDEALVRQLRPLKGEQMNAVLDLMRKHNRYLSMIFTGYNPAFIIKNASRDAITGTINMTGNHGAVTSAKAWAKYPMAWATMLQWAATKKTPNTAMGRILDEYRAQGGKTGASYMSDLEEQGKNLGRMFDDAKGAFSYAKDGRVGKAAWIAARKAIGGLAHTVEVLNQAFENALRLALFAQLRAEGQKPGVAAAAAKSVTVNFDRKGVMTPQLGAFYLFINPAIQGTANMSRTLTQGEYKYQAWALTGMMAAAGFAAAVHGMDDDKDRWLGQSWGDRTKNLRFRVGETTINIPMSYEFAPFYAIGVAMGEVARGESSIRAAVRTMSSFLDAYYPMQGAIQPGSDNIGMDLLLAHIPTVGRVPAQSWTNRNSFGSKVVPESDFTKAKPDNLKMNRSTNGSPYDRAAQAIAGAGELVGADKYSNDLSKVSPETLKLIYSTYTGGLGRFIADSASFATFSAKSDVDLDFNDVPILKDFVKTDSVNPIRSRFYDLSKEVEAASSRISMVKKGGVKADMEKAYKSPDAQIAALSKAMASYKKKQDEYSDQIIDINSDKSLTLGQKRQALKDIDEKQESMYREAIVTIYKQMNKAANMGK